MEGIFSNVMIFIFGASIGSFSNVLIDRLPKGKSVSGRSHCDYCGKKITWYDLFPIFSFIYLKARSRCCHKKLSFQYPAIETLMAVLFLVVFLYKAPTLAMGEYYLPQLINLLAIWGLVASMVVIFMSDLKYHLISDYLLISLFMFALTYIITDGTIIILGNNLSSLIDILFLRFSSGVIVAIPIFLLYYISHERAMGLGDVYLSLIIGFLLGWKEVILLYI